MSNKDKENEDDQQKNKKNQVDEMKRGDYRIHVYLEQTKDLKVPQDSTVDPIIEISCLGLKQYSSSKTKISGIEQVNWSEHLFLEPKNVEKKAAEDAIIAIKILEKGFLRSSTIGMFEFDMSYIYFKDNHAMLHQWVALSDPNSAHFDQITGYLKLSINVTCQGDEPIQIQDQVDQDQQTHIMMPPSLNPEFYQLKFRIFQAQQLPMMDIGMGIGFIGRKSKTDAYVSTQYKKIILKTEVKVCEKNDQPAEWNQEFWIPAQIPIVQKYLTLKIMDQDDDADEVIGSIHFDFKKIIDGSYNDEFIWKNIYGSPVKTSVLESQNKKYKRLMDENPDEASTWKGRVLIQMSCEKTQKPQVKVERIEDIYLEQSKQFLQTKEYDIIAEIGQGIALPQDKAFKIKFQVGALSLTSDKGHHSGTTNYNRFNKRIDQKTYKSTSQNIEEFEKLFIYLLDENDDPICFYKDSIKNYTDPNPEYQWIQFQPDRCINSVQNVNNAGLLSFKLSIHDKSAGHINFKDYESWNNTPMKRAVPVKIRAYIYQCRDLPAADDDGCSDPYVKIWDVNTGLNSNQKRTKVIQDNVNPLFYQCIELDYEIIKNDINDLSCYPPFIVDVFDEDRGLFDSKDDYLCRAIINPKDSAITLQDEFQNDKSLEIPTTPKWHQLRFAKYGPVSGEVLISFSVSLLDYNYRQKAQRVDLSKTIEYKDCEVNMIILGLRQLQSTGILPVKKAFITFNVKNLAPAAFALQNIQTLPKASGPNPTINTTINFIVPLPVNQLYCPRLSCKVQDYICQGFSQPQIGVFTIPIGELMIELQNERKEELENIQKIIESLEKIVLEGPELQVQDFSAIIKQENIERSNSINSKKSLNRQQNLQQIEFAYSDSQYDNETEFHRNSVGSSFENTQIYSARNYGSNTILEKKLSDFDSESYSNKTLLKQKKTYQKILKGSSIENEVNEQLGANQIEAEIQAKDNQMNNLLEIQKIIKYIKRTGKLPVQNNEDEIIQKSQLSIMKFKKQDSLQNQKISKEEIQQKLQEYQNKEKNILESFKAKAKQDLLYQGSEVTNIIIKPQYKEDERLKVDREVNQPCSSLYQALGWDEDKSSDRKHYRLYYNDELENIKDIFPQKSPFDSFTLTIGQTRGVSKGVLNFLSNIKKDDSGQLSTLREVGQFKSIIQVQSKEDKQNYNFEKNDLIDRLKTLIHTIQKQKYGEEERLNVDIENLASVIERQKVELKFRELGIGHLDITKHLTNLEYEFILKRQLMGKSKCIIRFYAIDADHLSSRDIGSDSDPYLYLTCNDKVFNERNNYQLDKSNPKFLKYFDFEGNFPGCSPLKIDIFDYDDIFGDDLIGSTSIDLEDRFFSIEWQSLPEKPIEVRQIYINSSSIDQGTIKCWVEIIDTEHPSKEIKIWDISEKPPETFEVRVCIFNCKDVKMMDIEGTSDVYCRGYFDSQEDAQETDTHYRNQDGKPDFQYRFIFQLQIPRKDYNFTLQMYDRDLIGSNELIGSTQINLQNLIQDCQLIKKPLGMSKDYYKQVLTSNGNIYPKLEFDPQDKTRFWLDMKQKDENGILEVNGKVKVKIDVLPKSFAEKNQVGKARDSPNHSPMLPQPEGRVEFTLNPLKMINQLFSQTFLYKVYCALCLILCVILILAILPNILGELIAKAI